MVGKFTILLSKVCLSNSTRCSFDHLYPLYGFDGEEARLSASQEPKCELDILFDIWKLLLFPMPHDEQDSYQQLLAFLG